jgi:omega-hydroxy-beta-dihydromenaquinone-9 sulfotransferase
MVRPRDARWRFWHNYLVGIPWDCWRALRSENQVDPGYRHRVAYLTAVSALNSFRRQQEERRYGAAIAQTRIKDPPLFVLGHWRTGTTYLHDLLACDTEQFAAPTTAQVSYPHSFLVTEKAVSRWGAMLPRSRPMDNVAIGMETPQEDEFALCVASLKSPCLGMFSFPRRADHYDRYLTFRGVPEPEVQEWKETFRWFSQKLTLRYGRALLLKSPPHTARVRLLLKLFPGARFVHIHRDPYAVFQSTQHLFQRMGPINWLQKPPADLTEPILQRHTRMFDAFFEEKALIPEGRFHEIRFEDLERDPVAQVRTTYERLGLDGFEALQPRLQQYVHSLAGYRRNQHAELSLELRRRVASAWQRSFDAWRYQI